MASDYQGRSAKQLLDVPVTALKGISSSLGKKLKEEFGISTIQEHGRQQARPVGAGSGAAGRCVRCGEPFFTDAQRQFLGRGRNVE